MKTDNADSGRSSGAGTSGTKPPPPDKPPEELNEADYLAQQASNAQLALSQALGQVSQRLREGVDPKLWAKEYPWITVGAAAVAGFLTAYTFVPSKEEQALKKLARIERALHPPPPPPRREEHGNGDSGKESHGGMLSTILHEALAVVRPALVSLLTANLANPAAAQGQAAEAENEGQFYGNPDSGGPPPAA